MKTYLILALALTTNLYASFDGPPSNAPASINMLSGHQAKVPVSRFFKQILEVGEAGVEHTLNVRTQNCSGPTGILVKALDANKGEFRNGKVSVKMQGKVSYEVIVFSQKRATALCEILWQQDDLAWKSLGQHHVGGTLVEVGALHADAFIEAHGAVDEMILFNHLKNTELIAVKGHRINVNSEAFNKGRVFVLLGSKVAETYVDLIRGPLNQETRLFALNDSVLLTPGRYAMWVNAKTSNAVGSLAVVKNPTRPIKIDRGPVILNRGQLNSDGFELSIERDGVNVSGSRKIPRGAFGSENEFHRFVLEINVETEGYYRIRADKVESLIEIDKTAFVVRNPESSELKIAELNMFYHDPKASRIDGYKDGSKNEYRNAADLLVTRGTVHADTMQIEERPDQAPYQLQADIAMITENRRVSFLEAFKQEAEMRNPLKWNFVHGDNEGTIFNIAVGRGAVFVSENLWPKSGMKTQVKHQQIDDANDSFRTKWIIPTEARIKRYSGAEDRQIGILGVHMHTQNDKGVDDRFYETKSIIARIKKMKGDRFIIIGDFNVMNQEIGEGYWLLRELRKNFGYAVDVALAVEGSVENNYGMNSLTEVKGKDWTEIDNNDPLKWLAPPFATSANYPWWAKTFRGATQEAGRAAERNDMILLVGRGWAGDDPSRAYLVVQDSIHENPFSTRNSDGKVLGAIEMYQASAGVGGIPDGGMNYNPNYSVGFGKGPGKTALMTDHRPIAARLRVFTP